MNDGHPLHVMQLSQQTVVIITLLVQTLLVGLLVISRARHVESVRFLFDSALLTIMIVLFSPTCWLATYLLIAFPLFATLSLVHTSPHRTLRDWPSLGVNGISSLKNA